MRVRAGAVAAAIMLAFASACSPATPSTDASPSGSGPPSPSRTTGAPADPAHAVDPPGPRRERLWPADMLVFSQETLSDQMVAGLKRIKGIEKVEPMSLAQTTIENRGYNIAAVDPATYRLFTPQTSADTLAVWTRVAGGEIAATPEAGHRLQDRAGYIKLGTSKDAPAIHVGAFAPQIPRVDLVLNEKWAEDLGMVTRNAVLITTDETSPQSVRPAIEKIVGTKASVQILGPDLDLSVQQTAVFTGGSVASVVGTFNYHVLSGGRIAPDPSWVASHIATERMPIIGNMTCNQAMFPQLRAALTEIENTPGLADQIHPSEYAGCYYPRFIAGTTVLSNHSFGLAFDINVPGNQRGTPGEIDRTVVSIFQKWGFTWGGTWSYTDPMHFELNRVVAPG